MEHFKYDLFLGTFKRINTFPLFLRLLSLFLFLYSPLAFAQKVVLNEPFDKEKVPAEPDYASDKSWASLPGMKDFSDTFAGKSPMVFNTELKDVDVFFIHPTSFIAEPTGRSKWNGDIEDESLNLKTDEGSIRYQASSFNGVGNIYAPRYRQAHYYSYLTKDTASARQAFNIAYQDVENAFMYYLEHFNQGRPFIIASHSQGTTHAIRLLQNKLDDKNLSQQLICAYIIGMPVYDTMFTALKPCKSKEETACYCTWRTYAFNYYPDDYVEPEVFTVCTNPLNWGINGDYASAKLNKGGILRDMSKIIPNLCDAQVRDGVLRIHKPHIKGRLFLKIKNYHIADYNLFYLNIHENALLRVKNYQKQKSR